MKIKDTFKFWRMFLAENSKPSLKEDRFVICIGDSQTHASYSYANRLALPKIVMSKVGRVTKIMNRKLQEYLKNPKKKATHAVIWGGTNDIAGATKNHAARARNAKKNIENMIKLLKSHNDAIKIALITLPTCLHNPWKSATNKKEIWISIEKAIADYNQQLGALPVDQVIEINNLEPRPEKSRCRPSKRKKDKGPGPLHKERLYDGLHPSKALQANLALEVDKFLEISK